MAAFSSFARLPMLRSDVSWPDRRSSLMAPLSPGELRRPSAPGQHSGPATTDPEDGGDRAGDGGDASVRGSGSFPSTLDDGGADIAALVAGGHPHVVAQAARGSAGVEAVVVVGVVHGCPPLLNIARPHPMPGRHVASATAVGSHTEGRSIPASSAVPGASRPPGPASTAGPHPSDQG